MVFRIGVLKNFTNFFGKQLLESPTQVFTCEICEIFKSTFFHITPSVAAFGSFCQLLPSFRNSLGTTDNVQLGVSPLLTDDSRRTVS